MLDFDYILKRSRRKTISIKINKKGEVVVSAPYHVTKGRIEAFLNEKSPWIIKNLELVKKDLQKAQAEGILSDEELSELILKAKTYIPERVKYYADLHGIDYGRITIRTQKTRWGSCSSKNNLNFNCLLMLTPPEVIDSVVVHELCHIGEMNHSERFYEKVLKIYPEYRKWDKWLKENGPAILIRAKL